MLGPYRIKKNTGKKLSLVFSFVLGLTLGVTFTSAAQEKSPIDNYVFGQAEAFLVAMHNIVISLSVDTERAAVNIAELNKKVSKLELRIAELEATKK
jgi:hypothetical protein